MVRWIGGKYGCWERDRLWRQPQARLIDDGVGPEYQACWWLGRWLGGLLIGRVRVSGGQGLVDSGQLGSIGLVAAEVIGWFSRRTMDGEKGNGQRVPVLRVKQ